MITSHNLNTPEDMFRLSDRAHGYAWARDGVSIWKTVVASQFRYDLLCSETSWSNGNLCITDVKRLLMPEMAFYLTRMPGSRQETTIAPMKVQDRTLMRRESIQPRRHIVRDVKRRSVFELVSAARLLFKPP